MKLFDLFRKRQEEVKNRLSMNFIFDNIYKILAILIIVFIIGMFYFKFFEFMSASGLFTAYGINISLYDWNNGYILAGIKGIILVVCMAISIYLLYRMTFAKKPMERVLLITFSWVVILSANFIIACLYSYDNYLVNCFIVFLFLIIEWGITRALYENDHLSNVMVCLTTTSLFIIVSFIGAFIMGYVSATDKNISTTCESAVLYNSKDYMIVAPYDVINNEVYIYTSYQEKINNDGFAITKERYNKVYIDTSLNKRL